MLLKLKIFNDKKIKNVRTKTLMSNKTLCVAS